MAKPMRSNQNLRVSWKPVDSQDCVWKNLYQITMRTILQEKGDNSLQHYNLVDKFIPMSQAMKIPAAKAAVDKEWEKLEKIPAWDLTKVTSKSIDNVSEIKCILPAVVNSLCGLRSCPLVWHLHGVRLLHGHVAHSSHTAEELRFSICV